MTSARPIVGSLQYELNSEGIGAMIALILGIQALCRDRFKRCIYTQIPENPIMFDAG